MKRKHIKGELMLVVAFLLIAGGTGGVLVRPTGEPDDVIESRFGDVTWNHGYHARMKEVGSCITCHHEQPADEKWEGKWGFGKAGMTGAKGCGECHKPVDLQRALINGKIWGIDPITAPPGQSQKSAMEIYHAKCLGCHKALDKGPVGCRDCHAQRFVGSYGETQWDHRKHARFMNMTCVDCHHKDKDRKETEIRPCGNCHKPAGEKVFDESVEVPEHEGAESPKFTHGLCISCHVENDPEVGVTECQDCHKTIVPKDKETPPSLEQAIHQRCLKCHNSGYEGLEPNMPAVCDDCHKPNPDVLDGGTAGPVLWSHTRHVKFTEWKCNECHHTDMPGETEPHLACYRCHGGDDYGEVPSLEKALHKRCTECHAKRVGFVGPKYEQDCNGCHSKKGAPDLWEYKGDKWQGTFDHRFHAEDASFSCSDCHHNTIRLEGRPWSACTNPMACVLEAADPQNCKNCHAEAGGPGPLAVQIHTNVKGSYQANMNKVCNHCHETLGVKYPEPYVPEKEQSPGRPGR